MSPKLLLHRGKKKRALHFVFFCTPLCVYDVICQVTMLDPTGHRTANLIYIRVYNYKVITIINIFRFSNVLTNVATCPVFKQQFSTAQANVDAQLET